MNLDSWRLRHATDTTGRNCRRSAAEAEPDIQAAIERESREQDREPVERFADGRLVIEGLRAQVPSGSGYGPATRPGAGPATPRRRTRRAQRDHPGG